MSTSRRCAPRSGGRAQVCPSILIVFSTRSSAPIGRNRILSGSSPGRLVADAQALRKRIDRPHRLRGRGHPRRMPRRRFRGVPGQAGRYPGIGAIDRSRRRGHTFRCRACATFSIGHCARPFRHEANFALIVPQCAHVQRADAMASNRRPAEVSRARSARPPNSSWWGSGARR
jgi:hypothetical protein